MKFLKTKLDGAFIIESEKSEDERGFFSNVWGKKIFQKNNLNVNITELNIAFNKKKRHDKRTSLSICALSRRKIS